MRAVLQRVDQAIITVDDERISSIGKGLLVFIGIEKGDSDIDVEYLLEKIVNLRIFEDMDGKMNLSLNDTSAEVLIVSQFTILGDCRKGRRPSFTTAAKLPVAKQLYDRFIMKAMGKKIPVVCGKFQSLMKVSLVNDGPVTILLDSKKRF